MSSISDRFVPRLMWLLGEGFVVFLGVAAALLGQAWFEERADRRIEHDLLSNVVAEAQANSATYAAARESLEGRRERLVALAAVIRDPALPGRADTIVSNVSLLLESFGTGLVSAALDDALQSGNLRLIEDPSARTDLARYRDWIRRVTERVEDYQDWVNGTVRLSLLENGLYRGWGSASQVRPTASVARARTRFADSPYLESLVHDEIYLHEELLNVVENFYGDLDEIVTRLEGVREAL